MSTLISHEPCLKCGSVDNLARYSDGHAFCFGCSYRENRSGGVPMIVRTVSESRASNKFISSDTLSYSALDDRKISLETCKFFGYQIGLGYNKLTKVNEECHVAPFYSNGTLIAQKLRFPSDKSFSWCGTSSDLLFGRHKWEAGGRYIVITEGELDCLAVAEVYKCKYPVVSIPSGANGALKTIKKELKWLEDNFDNIVLMFDEDTAGREAVAAVAPLFSPDKCLIAKLSEKDACDMLKAGKVQELASAVFKAKPYRPEGIISGEDIWDIVRDPPKLADALYPYECLNEVLFGLRVQEVVTVVAGSGIGKSQFCREIAYYLIDTGETVGYIALEESVRKTALGLMSIAANQPLHLKQDSVPIEVLESLYNKTVGNGRVYFYDHFGSLQSDRLITNLRYLVNSCNCKFIILDHISIVVSGIDEGDERKTIDKLMTDLRSLAQSLKVCLIIVSHLKRPEGKGHEDGAVTHLSQLRGSASIAQLSDTVIGLERNQQATNGNITTVRVLKNRYAGETRVAGHLEYFKDTGRLFEVKPFDTLEY